MKFEKQILEALRKCASSSFWGQVQIDFQHGQAVVLRVSETMKLTEENNRYGKSSE